MKPTTKELEAAYAVYESTRQASLKSFALAAAAPGSGFGSPYDKACKAAFKAHAAHLAAEETYKRLAKAK